MSDLPSVELTPSMLRGADPKDISNYVSRLNAPRRKPFSSPFFDGNYVQTYIHTKDFTQRSISALPDDLLFREMEESGLAKFGPRSNFKFGISDLEKWDASVSAVKTKTPPNKALLRKAREVILEVLGKPELQAVSIEEATDKVDKTTASGAPWFATKRDVMDLIVASAKQTIDGKGDPYPRPALLAFRAKEGKLENDNFKDDSEFPFDKTGLRLIWIDSGDNTLVDGMTTAPLIDLLKDRGVHKTLAGPEVLNPYLSELVRSDKVKYSLDVSAFDQNVSSTWLHWAYDLIEELFAPSARRYLKLSRQSMTNKVMASPWFYTPMEDMVLSGSGYTNLVDTFISLGRIVIILDQIFNEKWQPDLGDANGDDAWICSMKEVDVAKISKLDAYLGFETSPDKQYVARNAVLFNSRAWVRELLEQLGSTYPFAPVSTMLNRIYFFERHFSGNKKVTERAGWSGHAMIAIMKASNLEGNPMFNDVMEFLVSKDERRLGLNDPKDLQSVIGRGAFAKSVLGVNPDLPFADVGLHGDPTSLAGVRWLIERSQSLTKAGKI
jgi:hypothetical protein